MGLPVPVPGARGAARRRDRREAVAAAQRSEARRVWW